jgi:hypothetical protein
MPDTECISYVERERDEGFSYPFGRGWSWATGGLVCEKEEGS